MKNVLFLLMFYFGLQDIYSQNIVAVVAKTKVAQNNNFDSLRRVGDDFCKEVEAKLQENYPAGVRFASVHLATIDKLLHLTFSAQIIKCSKEDAIAYFSHAGALLEDTNLTTASEKAYVKANDQKLKIITAFEQKFGSFRVVESSDDSTPCGDLW